MCGYKTEIYITKIFHEKYRYKTKQILPLLNKNTLNCPTFLIYTGFT